MPIDPNIVSGLAPAAANLAQMGTFAQQQTAMEARRKREEEQRKQQQVADILRSAKDDDEAIARLNQLDIKLGSDYSTQVSAKHESARKVFKSDLDNDIAETQLLRSVAQGIKDKPTLETARKIYASFGEDGPKLAQMLPADWDDATSPAQMEQFINQGLTAEQYTKKQADALERALKGDWRHGLAETLATVDTPEEAQGAFVGYQAMGMPKMDLDQFAPLVQNWSPDAKKKAGEMALSEQQRQTLAGQERTAARADDAAARLEGSAAEAARHNRAMEGNSAQTNARLAAATAQGPSKTLSATAESNIINRLSNQWMTASKPTRTLDTAVSVMDQGMQAARRGDKAAGSQAVLVTFQKILDPTSVVRESEYARSSAGLALMDRIQGAYERLAQGGAGVPIDELEKFARLAHEMANAQRQNVTTIRERIGKTADRYNIPRELVTEEQAQAGASAQTAAPAASATTSMPPPAFMTANAGKRVTLTNGQVWDVAPDGKSAKQVK